MTEEEALALSANEEALLGGMENLPEVAHAPNTTNPNAIPETSHEILMTDEEWVNHWVGNRTFIVSESSPSSADKNVLADSLVKNDVCPPMTDGVPAIPVHVDTINEHVFAATPTKFDLVENQSPVLDSGATATVAGIKWIQRWLSKSKESRRPQIQASVKSFRFGDSRLFNS